VGALARDESLRVAARFREGARFRVPAGRQYVGDDFLLRRQDYHADMVGSFAAAQYVTDFMDTAGIRFATKLRACVRGPDLAPLRDLLMVATDLGDFRLAPRSG
jgi:hypothetical protein